MQINTSKSSVNFTIKKLFFLTVKGTLQQVKGEVELDENNLANSTIDLAIPIERIDTRNTKRNEHLLQKDFFYIEKYPEIRFTSTSINKENDIYIAKGNLSMVGVTNSVEIPFEFKNNRATGEFSLNRLDYKLGKIPTAIVANKVNISFDCSL